MKINTKFPLPLLLLMSLLGACSPAETTPAVSATAPVDQATATPAASATPELGDPLVVCLGQEPNSLYPLGQPNQAARQVLAAIYDGPIDELSYQNQPVILEELPSLENGGVQLTQVSVAPGERVVSADGTPTILGAGVLLRPAGCSGDDCLLEYQSGEVMMDQMTATFKLLPDLLWSDGTPLSAGDSVYAHRLNAAGSQAAQFRVQRTLSYQALDETTVVWTGLPGYLTQQPLDYFWAPAPEYLWGDSLPDELPESELAAKAPLGWGPFVLVDWQPGQQILLQRNPNYFRAAEGLPLQDQLIFRFIENEAETALAALLDGQCDLLGEGFDLTPALAELQAQAEQGQLNLATSTGSTWEHLDFGMLHRDYDDGYNQGLGDRADFFSDLRLRQAVAYCIDRGALVGELSAGQGEVLSSYLPAQHPLYDAETMQYPYEPETGNSMLESMGWLAGEAGVRVAQGVPNVLDGTALSFGYLTSDDPQNAAMAELIKADLADCGVEVEIELRPADQLLASGPDGPLFGRQFDLAQFAWPFEQEPACYLYLGEAIPGDDLSTHRYGWGGWNLTGWQNEQYDAACQAAQLAAPGDPVYEESQRLAQEIFAEELPVLPLYAPPRLAAARPDICGLQLDATAGLLWNIESMAYGDYCP